MGNGGIEPRSSYCYIPVAPAICVSAYRLSLPQYGGSVPRQSSVYGFPLPIFKDFTLSKIVPS
ncbi:MAG: hypothetical protein IIY21_27835 [Clostridiales bacterium]|nr:hypothetical protein [Clostridiales bacterium]